MVFSECEFQIDLEIESKGKIVSAKLQISLNKHCSGKSCMCIVNQYQCYSKHLGMYSSEKKITKWQILLILLK